MPECFVRETPPLKTKGVSAVVECTPSMWDFYSLKDLRSHSLKILTYVKQKLRLPIADAVFTENESIGNEYMIHFFHFITDSGEKVSSCRLMSRGRQVIKAVCTLSKRFVDPSLIKLMFTSNPQGEEPELSSAPTDMEGRPPGQTYIPNFIIYRILGQPQMDVSVWRLKVDGKVKNPKKYAYEELKWMTTDEFMSDFHCVTGWSVKAMVWKGVPTEAIAKEVGVEDGARWVYVRCADGYTTVIPVKDFLNKKSVIALYLNGEILSPEQGYPARLFIPHLYGWKSAKWVTEITFLDTYKDGYWESLGYHPRGNVWFEERFK